MSNDNSDSVMYFCEACNSYHVDPKNKKHHEALKCKAPYKERVPVKQVQFVCKSDLFKGFSILRKAFDKDGLDDLSHGAICHSMMKISDLLYEMENIGLSDDNFKKRCEEVGREMLVDLGN